MAVEKNVLKEIRDANRCAIVQRRECAIFAYGVLEDLADIKNVSVCRAMVDAGRISGVIGQATLYLAEQPLNGTVQNMVLSAYEPLMSVVQYLSANVIPILKLHVTPQQCSGVRDPKVVYTEVDLEFLVE